jgi:hypothetical protein
VDCRKKIVSLGLVFYQFLSHSAIAELNNFTAIYKLESLAINQATATTRLTITNHHYRFESHIQPVGWIGLLNNADRYEFSEGLIKNKQIKPERYSYQHSERIGSNREVNILFDNKQGKITNIHKHINNKWKMDSVDQVQDRLSSQISLMLALQQSGTPEKKQHFEYSIADGGRLKQYSFKIITEEKLETSLGVLNTIKLEHRRSNLDGLMILWCAEEFAYLPVKILHQQSGLPDYISNIHLYKKE